MKRFLTSAKESVSDRKIPAKAMFLPVLILMLLVSSSALGQLGVYAFTGSKDCPTQNPNVTSQPANAVFSSFSSVNTKCKTDDDDICCHEEWNTSGTINLSEYHAFSITADANFTLTLTSFSFTQFVKDEDAGNTQWVLRSSVDNYATNLGSGLALENSQTPIVVLPASHTGIASVTFRLYLINSKDNSNLWTVDNVTVDGSVVASAPPPADPANPTSDSPQCSNPGVTITANGTAPVGEVWYWQTTADGTSTANSAATYVVATSGTYFIRSLDTTTMIWSTGAGSITVTVTPDVTIPVFTLGATSSRCDLGQTLTYDATASNAILISYSLDAASLSAGNTIDISTGAVTYAPGYTGTSIITATATGCAGPQSSTHTVTVNPNVGVPVFALGATSTRCRAAGTVTYGATATDATGISYSLDAASIAGGNSINASTGAVTFAAGWSGVSTVTVTANGCNGPQTAIHTITTNGNVGNPSFTLGANSTRCQGAGVVSYSATATNNTGITYSLNAPALAAGNTIDASTGEVTYVAGWTGATVITATATGCNGPRSANHNVTITPTVGVPVFTLGATSTRCASNSTVNYSASATNTTGITYSLDAASLAGGLSINSSTGAVTYVVGWSGTTVITASAAGCNGPRTAIHTVTVNGLVGAPVFTLGASSTRCLGASTIVYSATAANSTGISYSLDLVSVLGGNSINAATGAVTFSALWIGTSTITATATGCNGPRTSTHTVTISPSVSTPSFVLGGSSTRCQGAGNVTYTASAANSSGMTYSLDAASIAGGNVINPATGDVAYAAGWSGTTTITASAAGCSGPKTATHTVTITPVVGTPVFTLGATSTRCQGANIVTYSATATNSTSVAYSLDAASVAGGNSINVTTGAVTFNAGWSGTSTITANALGCSGPRTAVHTVTTNASVATPVFTAGATSTRCQGAGSVTYSATAANATSITYSLDAASIAGGNTINAATGAVNFAAGWYGTSTITVSAAGCNGPRTAAHTVTVTPTVGTPVFFLGSSSSRTQGATTVTYTASAANTSGITYTLDAASLAAGNTINAATGAVTYTASWSGTTVITASAAGCGGPRTSTHTVTINASWVYKQLYLSDPSQSLDRVDPVATSDATTASTTLLNTTGTVSTSFTMNPVLCDSLKIKAGTITVRAYVTVSTGTLPANPSVTALLTYNGTTIINLTNPTYSGGMLTWTGALASDVLVSAGQAIAIQFTTAQAGVTFRIDFDSQTKPSRIDLPVSSYINVLSAGIYTAPYPGGTQVVSGTGGTTKYIRATVTDPFGSADITALNVTITPTGNTFAATSVGTSGCTRTFEYVWNTPVTSGNYIITATAKEGYENTVSNSMNADYSICTTCAPVAMNDSTNGAGGDPIVVDVLANDYDPNNNLNPATLTIVGQPRNGSAYISNNTIIYLPNGTFQGLDTVTYQICDLTSPTPLCDVAQVFLTIDPLIVDICADATKTHVYYIPYPENDAYDALAASGSPSMPSNNLRTVISVKIPYAGMTIVWDEWEDGYEVNAMNPLQTTTKVWGDGNPYNGIAPGYPSDIIPANGNIILDNTMNANPRNPASVYFDGKDKITSNGQLAITQVTGEPSIMSVQAIKTNVTSTYDFGQSFTIPLGQDFPSQDFRYTALFIRAAENNTLVSIDKDNNGTLETTVTLNEGESYLVNGGVRTGATVTSTKPVGVELNAGGDDNYSIRNAPIYPATWYSHTYYTPVPTSDNATDNPKDSSVVMFYNSLNRPISINWYSGAPANGVITVPAKTAIRFPLAYSTTSTYKFVNPTGESFTAIEIVGSYSPGGGGASGAGYDWAFNLISEQRLTDYTTVAWAPGGLDLDSDGSPDVNGNPIWVTPTANTTIYIKYDGNVNGTGGSASPCGLRYDVSYNLNALNYLKIRDTDNDQSGIAIFTCNGAKIAAVYGEDPRGSTAGNSAYWDVGTTLQPFCKQKLVVASDDYASTLVSQPVTISILGNDFGFTATIDPSSVSTLGLLQPKHGTVSINSNGTILYVPDPGFSGVDTFEYRVCSTPSPIVCDNAVVIVRISTCPSNGNQNVLSGQVFIDRNKDGINNDGGLGLPNIKVYLYTDGNCSGNINANELTDSVMVDTSGYYQFVKYPEKTVEDDFKTAAGAASCSNGSDGDSPWNGNWSDNNDASSGYCQGVADADVEIARDGAFGFGLRLKDNDVSARRTVNLNGAVKAFLTFSYRRKMSSLTAGEDIYVQVSQNGFSYTTIYTIEGNGSSDANYVTVYNQDISAYASSSTAIRILTNGNVDNSDTVYIGSVTIKYLKYPQCYITAIGSVPSYYAMTTVSSKTMTIAAGGTCSSNFDFGLAKTNVTVSGRLLNDMNGLTNGVVDGAAIGAPGGATVYAYLLDYQDKVAFKTTVNSGTGAYSFPLAEVLTDYSLVLSTTNLPLGQDAPTPAGWSSLWISVGDAYGTNNLAGTGNEAGTPNTWIAVKTGITNVTNVNFGVQRLPNTDSYLTSINHPNVNQLITLNGGMNPPVLSGSDPEDCVAGCVLTTKTVTIDVVPVNAELYYNGSLVVNNQTINNFNPSLFTLRITGATIGDSTVRFQYSYVDAAMMKDPTPAMYTLVWLYALPADRLVATASLDGNTTTVKWSTLSEQNTKHFIVERSTDNATWKATGNPVAAAGTSTEKTEYQLPDDVTDLMQSKSIFYRVKLVDFDGKVSYSNVAVVKITSKLQVTAWPNPFQSTIAISVNSDKATTFNIKMSDINGRLIRTMSQSVSRGSSQITLRDFDRLPAGLYLLQITDEKTMTSTVERLIKN